MAKSFSFGLVALCLVPTVGTAKGNKVSQHDIVVTKRIDSSSPITARPAGPIALPYPNSSGSKNKK
jgi:hypothetical protein